MTCFFNFLSLSLSLSLNIYIWSTNTKNLHKKVLNAVMEDHVKNLETYYNYEQ